MRPQSEQRAARREDACGHRLPHQREIGPTRPTTPSQIAAGVNANSEFHGAPPWREHNAPSERQTAGASISGDFAGRFLRRRRGGIAGTNSHAPRSRICKDSNRPSSCNRRESRVWRPFVQHRRRADRIAFECFLQGAAGQYVGIIAAGSAQYPQLASDGGAGAFGGGGPIGMSRPTRSRKFPHTERIRAGYRRNARAAL